MHILYTGFKGQNNSSFTLVNAFQGDKLLLTNSFDGLKRDINKISRSYDCIYMFGLNKQLKHEIQIEICAEINGERKYSGMDLSYMKKVLDRKAIPYTISESPTQYLCNAAYYAMLCRENNTIFIHIPPIRNISKELLADLQEVFSNMK